MLKTNGFSASSTGKLGRAGQHRANGKAANGAPMLSRNAGTQDHPRQLSSLLVALARGMFGGDDHIAELPLRQLRVCSILYGGVKTMSELSRQLGVSLSAMTQIADRLERSHLVKRSFEGTDRRVRCLQLTARGQRIMRLREDARTHRVSQVLRRLSAGEQASVIGALEILLRACEETKS